MIREKFYVEIQGGQVTPVAPSWGRPCVHHTNVERKFSSESHRIKSKNQLKQQIQRIA